MEVKTNTAAQVVAGLKKSVIKTSRRGRPKGSKNKIKKAIRAAQRVNVQTANLDRDGIIAALGLMLVAVDILKRSIN